MSKDPLHTRLCEDLGIEFPVAAFTHCKDVVVAIANAGGLAVLGAGSMSQDELKQAIDWIRERIGDKPFGMDVLIPASVPPSANLEELEEQIPQAHRDFVASIKRDHNVPDPKPKSAEDNRRLRANRTQEFARNQLDVLLEERVPVLAAGLGNPAFILEEAHSRGIKVFGLVGNVRQAVREAEAGVDYIIAQGTDSGGHTGEIGTFSVVPQVVAAVSPTPVLCAGGVGTGRHLAASLCLGAVGVWTGSIWLASTESDTDMIVKQKILDATERDTVRSRCYSGKPIRQIRTAWTDHWEQPGAPQPLPMPLQGILVGEVTEAVKDHRVADLMGTPMGQVVGTINEIKPAGQILFDIVSEAQDIIENFSPVSTGA